MSNKLIINSYNITLLIYCILKSIRIYCVTNNKLTYYPFETIASYRNAFTLSSYAITFVFRLKLLQCRRSILFNFVYSASVYSDAHMCSSRVLQSRWVIAICISRISEKEGISREFEEQKACWRNRRILCEVQLTSLLSLSHISREKRKRGKKREREMGKVQKKRTNILYITCWKIIAFVEIQQK